MTHPLEIEALEQAELLQEDGSLAPGAGLQHRQSLVVDPERLLVRRRPVAQVLCGEQTRVTLAGAVQPLLLLEAHDRVRDEAAIPAVECRVDIPVRLVQDPAVGRGELRIAVQRPRFRHGKIHGRRGRPLVAEELLDVANRPRDLRQHRIALLCVADREAQHVAEWKRAVVAEHREPPAERAGHHGGERPRPRHELETEVVAIARDRRSLRSRSLRAQDDGLIACVPEQRR